MSDEASTHNKIRQKDYSSSVKPIIMSSSSDESTNFKKEIDIGDSSASNTNNGSGDATVTGDKNNKEVLVETESRYVLFLRLVVLLVLLMAAIAVSVMVHRITLTGEDFSFITNYDAAAEKVTGER